MGAALSLTSSPCGPGAGSGEGRRVFGSGTSEQLATGKAAGIFGNYSEIKTLPVARLVATSHPFSQKKVKATGWKDK